MNHVTEAHQAARRLLVVCLGLVALALVHAASLIVNTLADNTTNGDGFCTLCQAIAAAKNNAN